MNRDADQDGPYEGLRVLDISQGFAGPYCAAILGEQGADVVKVEPPRGDWGRRIGARHGDNTAFGIAANAGKRSICVDGYSPGGRNVLHRLARNADVVVQNFREGVAERMGIGFDELHAVQPGLVYTSVTGFGSQGPWATRPATDTIVQGVSGLMMLNADASGWPRRVPFTLIDVVTGIYAAQRVGAALYTRSRTGTGSHVEVSLLTAASALLSAPLLDRALAEATDEEARPMVPLSVPVGPFATADGHLNISCINDKMFVQICEVLGFDDWVTDPGMSSIDQRVERFEEIQARVGEHLRERTTAEWLERFATADLLCGPVNDGTDLMRDPQAGDLGIFRPLQAAGVEVPMARVPGSAASEDTPTSAPERGEHSVEVLREHGWGEPEIDELLRVGAVREAGT